MSDLVYRLKKRAEIRRQIPNRKSVQNGERDRIADLLEEAAEEINRLNNLLKIVQPTVGAYKGCQVCGISGIMGYVCTSTHCPIRITCGGVSI